MLKYPLWHNPIKYELSTLNNCHVPIQIELAFYFLLDYRSPLRAVCIVLQKKHYLLSKQNYRQINGNIALNLHRCKHKTTGASVKPNGKPIYRTSYFNTCTRSNISHYMQLCQDCIGVKTCQYVAEGQETTVPRLGEINKHCALAFIVFAMVWITAWQDSNLCNNKTSFLDVKNTASGEHCLTSKYMYCFCYSDWRSFCSHIYLTKN